MKKLLGDLGASWEFLAAGIRQFDKNASLVPSSPFLVRAMLESVSLERAKCVVELGPGVGTVTEEILRQLPARAHLHAIELDEKLLGVMRQRFPDPRLRPIHGSAAETARLLAADGCSCRADAVFSSLGFALMDPALRRQIVQSVVDSLAPRGHFVQYAYLHARFVNYTQHEGWSRFHARRFFARRFEHIEETVVLANVPPASVLVCRKPTVREITGELGLREKKGKLQRNRRARLRLTGRR
jgi:phospholipid N-methyltransferase